MWGRHDWGGDIFVCRGRLGPRRLVRKDDSPMDRTKPHLNSRQEQDDSRSHRFESGGYSCNRRTSTN